MKKKPFVSVIMFILLGLQTFLYGQEPNEAADPNIIIANLEKKLEQKNRLLEKLKKDLIAERKEKERLMKLCKGAGINYEITQEQIQAEPDYKICSTIIKPNTGSDSMATLGFTKIEPGTIGWIDYLSLHQIVDPNNAIVNIILHNADGSFQFVNYTPIEATVWLKGVYTQGYADGTRININHHFAVTGTKTYETAMGSKKTIYAIEPIILSPNLQKIEKAKFENLKSQYQAGKWRDSGAWPPSISNSSKGTNNSKGMRNIKNNR